MALPHGAVGWSVVCDWYFLIILTFLVYTSVLQYQETQAVSAGVQWARMEEASSWYVNKAIHGLRPDYCRANQE